VALNPSETTAITWLVSGASTCPPESPKQVPPRPPTELGLLSVCRLTRDELRARLKHGDVLDVRPTTEYAAGHIKGAVSLPVGEIDRRLRSIPKDREVVAHCRGPYCVYADDLEGRSVRRSLADATFGATYEVLWPGYSVGLVPLFGIKKTDGLAVEPAAPDTDQRKA